MSLTLKSSVLSLCVACTLAAPLTLLAQQPTPAVTADQDHQNMMDQLGIKALRPGPSGDEKAPNHANYDESKANPYPDLPDPLTLNNGGKVTTAKVWWDERRPQNHPGTESADNWRRRARRVLEDFSADPEINRTLSELTTARAS